MTDLYAAPWAGRSLWIYNPLFQNQTHAQVIGALTRVPVTPLVVSAANIMVPHTLAADVVPLAGLAAHLGPPGPASPRIQAAFDVLVRRKAGWGQKRLSERHRRWMVYNRRFDPVRAL